MCVWMSVILFACSKQPTPSSSTAITPNPSSSVIEATLTTAPIPIPAKEEDKETLKNTTGKTVFKSFTNAKEGHYHATVVRLLEVGEV